MSPSTTSVEVFGYCRARETRILSLIEAGQARELIFLGGNFVIVARKGPQVWIATSAYGAVAYFFRNQAGQFSHGATVSDVLGTHPTAWRWNYGALIDLFALEHLTGCDSLHAEVQRTPAASILHWNGTALEEWSATWTQIHERFEATGDPGRMVDTLRDEVIEWAGPSPVLSASGGFDSRLLLAAMLSAGLKPDLLVQGTPESTDRVVVEAIGRRFGLRVRPVEAETDDYLECAPRVSRATNGTKATGHWHTYIYPAKAALHSGNRLFVGANGEFVRTYYLDRGIVANAADCLPPRLGLRQFWQRKLKRAFTGQDIAGLRPPLAERFQDGRPAQIVRLAGARPGGSVLRQLDHFYLEERVRHFIGNGLALYGLSARWITPLLSPAWVAEADRLPRRWKLGNHWHRYAIARLLPQLMDFPEEAVAAFMARRRPLFYWLPARRSQKVVPYMDYRKVFADERVLGLLSQLAPELDELFNEQLIPALIAEHRERGTRGRLISILLAMAQWRREVVQLGRK
jgi:hypothetical protein